MKLASLADLVKRYGHRMHITPAGCVYLLTEYEREPAVRPAFGGRKGSRVVLELKLGRPLLPEQEEVACHTCDDPRCINWWHLWPGTQADNIKDAVAKGRHARTNQYTAGASVTPKQRAVLRNGAELGRHNRWHVARGVKKTSCHLCTTAVQ